MTPIETPRLLLRNWRDEDRPLFHRINSDDTVMAFFPFRRSRDQSDALMDELKADIDELGYGFAAAARREDGALIGFVGIQEADLQPMLPAGTIEIGWRLAPEFWGHGYVTEAAEAWLAFGFETLGLAEIVSLAVHDNHRSTAVMRRLGMRHDPGRDFEHPRVSTASAALRKHVFYCLGRDEWRASRRSGAPPSVL